MLPLPSHLYPHSLALRPAVPLLESAEGRRLPVRIKRVTASRHLGRRIPPAAIEAGLRGALVGERAGAAVHQSRRRGCSCWGEGQCSCADEEGCPAGLSEGECCGEVWRAGGMHSSPVTHVYPPTVLMHAQRSQVQAGSLASLLPG